MKWQTLFAACFCSQGFAQESANLSLVVLATSDWTYHGVSETRGEPSVGINLDWQPTRHLFLGVEAHQGRVSAERQREGSVMGYIGTGWSLSENWYGTLALQQREFPGSTKEWDITEFTTSFTHDSGLRASLSYSPDYYEHNTEAANIEIGYVHQSNRRWHWSFEAGTTEFFEDEPRFVDYQYARAGIGLSFGRSNVNVAYAWTNASATETFGAESNESPGLVVGFSYRVQ
ncbi:MAG: hypothetical protein AAF438_07995 [Pseudomonadota bacterium]